MHITYVIPCGAEKHDDFAYASDMYIGAMFQHTLGNVLLRAEQDRADGHTVQVLILSAWYGLITLDRLIAPYDVRMDQVDPDELIPMLQSQLVALVPADGEIYALLPRAYYNVLSVAAQEIFMYPMDVYEACEGIGDQRHVNANIGRNDWRAVEGDDLPGPRVWIGGDVPSIMWGVPVLLSYGRLRKAKRLHRAIAPWVCDSRGFNEIMDHGRWTITVEEYAADLIRYADQIGMPEWVAPQDWPAAAPMLERTGLTEEEHQQYTIAAYEALVRLVDPHGIHVIPVVTGTTGAGYLRHLAMWKTAGYDLTAMDTVVGVGALVKRAPSEAADIIRALHAAGVRRMHGFGLKGPVLGLVGPLLESVDSAEWSGDARRNAEERCPHGLVKYERNCRVYAMQWAARQQVYAAQAQVQLMLPAA